MLNLESQKDVPIEKDWWLKDPTSKRKAFGLVLHKTGEVWTVARCLIGSPAEQAGVLSGERLMSVDGYMLEPGSFVELFSLMSESTSSTYELSFQSDSGDIVRKINADSLRDILERDFSNGGAKLLYCVGCRTCRPVSIGATHCGPGACADYCTIA